MLSQEGKGQKKNLDIEYKSHDKELNTKLLSKTSGVYKDSLKMMKALDQMLSELHKEGYLTASIDSLVETRDTIQAFLFPGKKYQFGIISLKEPYPEFLSPELKKKERNKRKLVTLKEFADWQTELLQKLVNSGYPFASLKASSYSFNGDTINAQYSIKTGNRYTIDTIYIKGSAKISHRFLNNYLGIYPGMKYDEAKLNAIPGKLEQLSFLKEIKEFEIEFSDNNKANLYLYVGSRKGNQADGLVGFVPGEGNEIRFTGRFDLLLNNSFRQGEQISANWRALEENTQELDLSFNYPFLFLQKIGLATNFNLFKKDTTYLNTHLNVEFPVHIDAYQSVGFIADFERSALIADQAENFSDFSEYQKELYGLKYKYKRLDHPLNPGKGNEFAVSVSVGRNQNKDSGKTGNNNSNKKTVNSEVLLSAVTYQPLWKKWVLKLANYSGWMQKYEDQNKKYFKNELYRFGGTKFLRGFRENTFLASLYSVANIEVRYLLSENSNIFIFGDGGYYVRKTENETKDFPIGFGLGANINTGVGIIKLSYAVGKQYNNPVNLQNAVVHISFISTF